MDNDSFFIKSELEFDFNEFLQKYQKNNPLILNYYLKDIFRELSNDNEGINFYNFREFINLPEYISKNLFRILSNSNNVISSKDFLVKMNNLYEGEFSQLTKIIFDFLDFNEDGKINYNDVKQILILSLNSKNHMDLIFSFIEKNLDSFFAECESENESKEMDLEKFEYLTENLNSDIFINLITYFYENKPFNNDIISYYMSDKRVKNFSILNNKVLSKSQTQSHNQSLKDTQNQIKFLDQSQSPSQSNSQSQSQSNLDILKGRKTLNEETFEFSPSISMMQRSKSINEDLKGNKILINKSNFSSSNENDSSIKNFLNSNEEQQFFITLNSGNEKFDGKRSSERAYIKSPNKIIHRNIFLDKYRKVATYTNINKIIEEEDIDEDMEFPTDELEDYEYINVPIFPKIRNLFYENDKISLKSELSYDTKKLQNSDSKRINKSDSISSVFYIYLYIKNKIKKFINFIFKL
jgi:hypothetical protein